MADKESVVRQTSEYTDIMEKNHMEIPWHDYAKADSNVLIAEADLIEKASVIGRVGLMMLSCGTGVSQSLSIANTGVNTSKLYRMERFVENFPKIEKQLTGEEIHKRLDEIEQIHALYSPWKLGVAAALACGAFTFLLGGGPVEMLFAFIAAGIGNFIRTRMIKHHSTLFLNIAVSVSAACLIYAICLNIA